MTHATERQASPVQQPLRNAALRRNLGTTAIIAVAFSGGPFGLTWLAASSSTTFLALMFWRLKQHKFFPSRILQTRIAVDIAAAAIGTPGIES